MTKPYETPHATEQDIINRAMLITKQLDKLTINDAMRVLDAAGLLVRSLNNVDCSSTEYQKAEKGLVGDSA